MNGPLFTAEKNRKSKYYYDSSHWKVEEEKRQSLFQKFPKTRTDAHQVEFISPIHMSLTAHHSSHDRKYVACSLCLWSRVIPIVRSLVRIFNLPVNNDNSAEQRGNNKKKNMYLCFR